MALVYVEMFICVTIVGRALLHHHGTTGLRGSFQCGYHDESLGVQEVHVGSFKHLFISCHLHFLEHSGSFNGVC